jgi:hypothetical protein
MWKDKQENAAGGHSGIASRLWGWIVYVAAMLFCFAFFGLLIAATLAFHSWVESVEAWFWSLFP